MKITWLDSAFNTALLHRGWLFPETLEVEWHDYMSAYAPENVSKTFIESGWYYANTKDKVTSSLETLLAAERTHKIAAVRKKKNKEFHREQWSAAPSRLARLRLRLQDIFTVDETGDHWPQ